MIAPPNGDSRLEGLLRDEFYRVGPLGFILPKPAWIGRHRHGLVYEAFDLDEIEIRRFGEVTLVRARNDTRGTFQGHPVPGSVRATSWPSPAREHRRWSPCT